MDAVVTKCGALLATPDLPSLGPEPRAGRDSLVSLEKKLGQFFRDTGLPEDAHALVRSLVLLWHDHLDESHSVSQEIHTADGSFLHGIMHRREPDYGNAKYWFRRVGQHPAFPPIAQRAAAAQKDSGDHDLGLNFSSGQWDSFAFIDACQSALKSPRDAEKIRRLQKIQEIEFRVLLELFCSQGRPEK
jgi:hypothetical protein